MFAEEIHRWATGGSTFGLNTAVDTLSTSSISDVCTAGTACTRASAVLILLILAVSWPAVLFVLPVYAVFLPPVPQYSQYPEYEWSILGASVLHCNAVRVKSAPRTVSLSGRPFSHKNSKFATLQFRFCTLPRATAAVQRTQEIVHQMAIGGKGRGGREQYAR